MFWTRTKGVSGWAPPTIGCSNVFSLSSYPSSLCFREALSWRSVVITFLNLAFSSLMARLRLTRSARLLAKTWAYEFAACSAEAVCPACSLAAGSVQRVCFDFESSSLSNECWAFFAGGRMCSVTVWVFNTPCLDNHPVCDQFLNTTDIHFQWPGRYVLHGQIAGAFSSAWGGGCMVLHQTFQSPRCVLAGLGCRRSGRMFLSVPSCLPW